MISAALLDPEIGLDDRSFGVPAESGVDNGLQIVPRRPADRLLCCCVIVDKNWEFPARREPKRMSNSRPTTC